MRRFNLPLLLIIFLSINLAAQKIGKNYLPIKSDNTPAWFHVFYTPDFEKTINVHYIDEIVEEYEDSLKAAFQKSLPADYEIKTGEEHENDYLRFYKRWRRKVDEYVQDGGTLKNNEAPEFYNRRSNTLSTRSSPTSQWRIIGPLSTHSPYSASNTTQPEISSQVNIYACAMAASNHDVLYAAPETGGIFKTINKGTTWTLVLDDLNVGADLFSTFSGDAYFSIDVHPSNPDIVYAGRKNLIKKSIDGGVTWTSATPACGEVNTIAINPNNTDEIYAACENGLYKSTDAGATWTRILTNNMRDVIVKIGTSSTAPATVYVLREATTDVVTFWKSIDGGANFTQSSWGTNFTLTRGARMTVSAIDPTRIYAVVLSKEVDGIANERPFIFKSTNSGDTWTFMCSGVTGDLGGNTTMPLGMSNGQGYYDLDIIANPMNADEVIVASTTAYKSTNGGASFTALGGYNGSFPIHPDIQCMVANGSDTWIATDGGMNYSTDFFSVRANMSVRNNGIFGSDFWGFAQGWNEDIIGGGKYHNGNSILSEAYPAGKATDHQGGESATGFYMMGRKRHIAFSDVPGTRKGVIAPETFTSPAGSFSFTKFPNEDNPGHNVSEVEFLPYSASTIYLGEGNQLWKSTDKGITWASVYAFGSPVREFEISRSNPDVIYLCTDAALLKSTNGGSTWSTITLPTGQTQTQKRITLSFTDENTLWITARNNTNNNRVFKTTDGGTSWENLTTPTINVGGYNNIVHQAGTDGGVYILRKGGIVFYRNKSMSDWVDFSMKLPKGTFPLKSIPFYRDSKLRMAGNRGVWEIDFYEEGAPVAQPMVDKLTTACPRDTFYFEDFSAVKHAGATWAWSFTGTSTPTFISSTSERNPKVVFGAVGTYDFALTVANAFGSSSKSITGKITVTSDGNCDLSTVVGKAISISNNTEHFRTPTISLNKNNGDNNNEITLMAWIRPNYTSNTNGVQNDYACLISTGTGTQLNLRNNNELGFHWFGTDEWQYSSGLIVPPNQWSHVALVANGSGVTLYLNGKPATRMVGITALDFSNIQWYVGYDPFSSSRTFKGLMDEVCLYNRAFLEHEVRMQMHLIKNPSSEPSLKGYFQFDETSGAAWNKAAASSSELTTGAVRTTSTAPLGTGTSQRMNITTGGIKDFSAQNVVLEFPSSGTFPNGEIVVNQITYSPDQNPTGGTPLSNKYWIINNYGTNATFSPLTSIKFNNLTGFASGTASNFKLYKRNFNADGATWGTTIDGAEALTGTNLTFNLPPLQCMGISNFGQFTITNDAATTPPSVSTAPCYPDTVPSQSASFTGASSSYIISDKPFPNNANDDFSISFWMKANDAVLPTTAADPRTILGTRNVSSGTSNTNRGWAFTIRRNGTTDELVFEIGDGSSASPSADHVKRVKTTFDITDDKWHYVAGTVNNIGNMTLYVDGVSIGTQSLSTVVTISNGAQLYFGKDNNGGESSYPYSGLIDEVKIWDVPLTVNDIREKMHLTAYPQEPNLVGYYQFNNDLATLGASEYDRKGINNLTFTTTASRVASTAPVGGGTFSRLSVTASGIKTFTDTDCEIDFSGGTLSSGDVVVSKLNIAPNVNPTTGTPLPNKYWIVNNFGTNPTFSTLTSIKFSNLGTFASGAANGFKLYKRPSNADAAWGASIDAGDVLTSTNNNTLTFSTNNGINTFSQFTIAKEGLTLSLKVFLEGSFNTSTSKMNDNLRSGNFIQSQTAEPYTSLGFAQFGGGGSEPLSSSSVYNTTGDNAIVDWVFVELRDASSVLYTRSALVQADGDVVDTDGVSPLLFGSAPAGSYYVAIKHRNHLRVKTTEAILLTTGVNTLNFTDGTLSGGTTPMKSVTSGAGTVNMMYAGDLNQDGSINPADRTAAWIARNIKGYNQNDCSMNGTVDATDRSNTWNNRNVSSGF
jgi:photosystem II stability/assembly factor-like uncharacterized protein